MPQFTHFLRLPPGEYRSAVDDVLRALRDMPAEGEPFKAFRGRLKRAGIWSRERLPQLLRFLRMAHTDPMIPSAFMRQLAEAPGLDAAREALLERLWTVNPLLFKVVLERLEERVHSANEVLKYVDSFAYPGNRISGPDVRAWVALVQGIGLFKPVGIRLALAPMAKPWLEKAHALDIEDFLDEDTDEPPPSGGAPQPVSGSAAPAQVAAPASSSVAAGRPVASPRPSPAPVAATVKPALTDGPSPLGQGRAVGIARFDTPGAFASDVLEITRDRLATWWTAWDQAGLAPSTEAPAGAPTSEDWMEDPPRALYRAAVLAGLIGRPGTLLDANERAFSELDRDGVLDALHDGMAPEGVPTINDAGALMLASVIARRCAEHPELASDLEKCRTAAEAFERLDAALGRGLFANELFDLMALLGRAGGVPNDGLTDFVTRPLRDVRDTLYRLGFIDRPYASSSTDRAAAAAAARRAVPAVQRADVVLTTFARRAGCAYGCTQRRRCDLPCRERTDPG